MITKSAWVLPIPSLLKNSQKVATDHLLHGLTFDTFAESKTNFKLFRKVSKNLPFINIFTEKEMATYKM